MTLDLKFFGVRTAWKASHGVTIYIWILRESI